MNEKTFIELYRKGVTLKIELKGEVWVVSIIPGKI